MEGLLQQTFMGNTVAAYLGSLAVFVAGIIAVKITDRIIVGRIRKHAEKTATTLDDFLVQVIEQKLMPIVYFGVFYLAIHDLALPPGLRKGIEVAGIALLTFLGIRLAIAAVHYGFEKYWESREVEEARKLNIRRLLPIIKVVLWLIGVVFLLDNLGFKINTVIAGLGIGGIAVALAAQAVLGDLFSYFAILFDRPFELGDFIIVDGHMGTVENVGIKTTRIRSLGGEQLVFSNTDLTGSRIRNYKRMQQRRVVFRLGVVYQTPLARLREIPGIIENIIQNTEGARFDRSHFASFGDFSLDFETVYYVLTGDYNVYMDTQQAINLAIAEEFESRGIEFAYPTQTLFLQRAQGWQGGHEG